MKKNIGLIVILVIFSIIYFVVANKISYDLGVNFEDDLYQMKIAAIEKQAAAYAENKKDMFAEGNSIYMTVEELSLANVIVSNSEGIVNDPRDNSKTLNDLKVKITNEDDKITAKVLV